MPGSIILVNPWIEDFAAYDLWAKPLGLLTLAGGLRQAGYRVHLVDCLDRHHPSLRTPAAPHSKSRRFGTGKFARLEIPRPPSLEQVPRPFSRYGIGSAAFKADLAAVEKPAAILVTSLMTYWYTGVQAAISAAREVHPRVPVLLGGIYARLCSDHALKSCGADQVLQTGAVPAVIAALKALGAAPAPAADAPAAHPYPAFDLLHGRDYVCLLASHGCPYNCHYCASHLLNPIFERRRPEQVTAEILYWHANHAVTDFAFYDDALLVPPQAGIRSVLEEVIRRAPGLRFHTPNALHLREIDREMAVLMRAAGFQTIRLGLESADFAKGHRLDEKVGAGEFERAVGHLLDAGFRGEQLGAYILAGLPGQQTAAVKAALNLVDQAGILPFLAEYSPIPGTILWPAAVAASRYDLTREPLYHNNTLLPCWDAAQRAQLPELRLRVRTIRERVRSDRNGLAKNGRMRGLPNPVA